MSKSKKNLSIILALVLVLANLSFISVANAVVEASPVFVSKALALSSSMKASMSASTSIVCSKIYVSSVTLEKKTGSTWGYDRALPCPSTSATNADSYSAGMDYSSYCTKGNTYRIVVTFNADGVTASATSPSATY